jgi:hypothetical protein
MKALCFSRFMYFVSLVLGFMTLWVAATPSAIGTNTFVGGWGPVGDNFCCNGTFTDDCNQAMSDAYTEDPNDNLGCGGGNIATICQGDPNDEDTCSPGLFIPCVSPTLPDDHPCNTTHDGDCPDD